MNLEMFKAFDIRTREELLGDDEARRLMDAIAYYLENVIGCSSIVLGRDARLGVPRLMQMACDVLPMYGIDVILNPLQISTCQFYFSCMQNPHSAGIMFTASHNPGCYIGLKIMVPRMIPLSMDNGPMGGISGLRQLFIEGRKPAITSGRGKIIVHRYLDQYLSYSLGLADIGKDSLFGLNLCMDFLSGAAGTEVMEAFSYAGVRIDAQNLVPDGRFPKGDPNPIVVSSIQPTWNLIRNGSYDFGLAFDGDGDRMDFITGRGEQLAPSFNFAIILPHLVKLFSPLFPRCSIYSDVKVNPLAQAIQARYADVGIIRNGHSFIKEALREKANQGFLAACEESAHYYLNFPYDLNDFSKGLASAENTLFFALLTAKAFTEAPKEYEKAMEIQGRTFRAREWPVQFKSDELMEQALKAVRTACVGEGMNAMENTPDGRSLDSTLMRKGIPAMIFKDTDFSGDWIQIVQRISRSEDKIARWEVTGSSPDGVEEARTKICSILQEYLK